MHAHCACTARMMNSRSTHTHDSCVCSEVPPGHLHEPVLDRRAALAFRPVSNVSGKEGPRGGEASGGLGLCISIHTYIRTYIHFGLRRRDRRVPFALLLGGAFCTKPPRWAGGVFYHSHGSFGGGGTSAGLPASSGVGPAGVRPTGSLALGAAR